MGGEACLVILAALSSSGAEEGYLTRVCCCEGGRSAVQASAGPRNRTGRGVWLLDLGGTQETEETGEEGRYIQRQRWPRNGPLGRDRRPGLME